ncbi:phosphoenolpyruvate carboxykinase (ATP) [Candidatus Uabimicrobium amorphum]|uniref:Phosphoenolpyruvate carboxykinase (ATP) n=1 Tax=Uabimicrobium amorphum TaxID=2596890 RepID=A0A5S9IN29_UABAM|nr:phosphoenolpyruvate carboxykinase (ATP) [Candidatus Uabimicrobium amorphum]BBM84889.1 phosphoenolpyruvate carboxykinase [ATP] 2 [Candidatus Uabimicrobium amorphum]
MKPNLEKHGILVKDIIHNASPARLYEEALAQEKGSAIVASGALAVKSGVKTGRSPKDKRIVDDPEVRDDIWWGDVNVKLDDHIFLVNRERAIDYLNTCSRIYIVDGFAGWDPKYRIKVRIVCTRAYHALFMNNMLIRASQEELQDFGEPDYTVFNAGKFPANRYTSKMTSKTSVSLCFNRKEFVILGTEYAGEMKKGVFTIMNYIMPKADVLSMHCSANEGKDGNVSLFFGLSGTGKTTLSADPERALIGDDEHCWSDDGVFNIEGGCYAKCIDLTEDKEPEIYRAIRFGTVLENVVYSEADRRVDYTNSSLTQNTRASYPIEYIDNAKIPCTGGHPKNIIFLTCDAFGVLPPVSRLTPEQAMYHFISGYTAKVAGTEMGVTEPEATFSACFGAAFLVWHPGKYAEMLAEKMQKHGAKAWLVNTGWSGGTYGVGARIKLKATRAIIDAINDNRLDDIETVEDPIFGFAIPTSCPNVAESLLQPKKTWADPQAYDQKAKELAHLFRKNFTAYESGVSDAVKAAAPKV